MTDRVSIERLRELLTCDPAFLGLHRTAEAAHAAYVKAAKEMFGEFARSS